jgi:iron complex outermembrane receptor protein
MNRLYVIILGFILVIGAVAQQDSSRLRGRVLDSQGQPLQGATVTVHESGVVALTNQQGEFTIALPSRSTVHVGYSAQGYFPQTRTFDTTHQAEQDVTLTRTVLVQQEISVEASRLQIPLAANPAATSIVGPEILSLLPRSVGAEEALAPVPGVKVDNQANQERVHVSIRGQGILSERGVRGIEVLLDGLPLNDPSGFVPDLFDVNWASVQEVDVVRGPVAFLYGGGSSGGVIDITTRTATDEPHAADAFSGGANGFYKSHTEYSQRIGGTNFFLSAARAAGDGYRTHTRFYGDNLYGKVNFKLGRSVQLTLIGSGTGYFNQNPEGLNLAQVRQDPHQPNPDALTFNEYQKTKRAMGGVTGKWTIAENQRLSFTTYGRYTHYDESVPSSLDHQNIGSPGGSAQYDAEVKTGAVKHHLSLGMDLDGQVTDDHRHPNLGYGLEGTDLLANQRITEKRLAGFLTERMELGRKWSLLGSIRWDQVSNQVQDFVKANSLDLSGERTFRRATGRVGLTFNPRTDLGFYTSWGQGFLPPATEELYANPDALGGFNRHLVPATSWGMEGGIRGSVRDRVFYDAAVFHLETRRDFERYRIAGRPLETFYGNAGESSRYGFETEIRWLPTPRVTLSSAYTYSHFVYSQYESGVYPGNLLGHWLPNSPNHQLYFETTLNLPKDFLLSVATQVYSRAFVDPTNQAFIDGYGLLNAHVSKRWQCGKFSCNAFVSGRNLTSTNYIAFTEPDPDGNSYQPGPRRELFGGLRVSF